MTRRKRRDGGPRARRPPPRGPDPSVAARERGPSGQGQAPHEVAQRQDRRGSHQHEPPRPGRVHAERGRQRDRKDRSRESPGAATSVSPDGARPAAPAERRHRRRKPQHDRRRRRRRGHPQRVDDRPQALGLREERRVVAQVENRRERFDRPRVTRDEGDQNQSGVGKKEQDRQRPAGRRHGPASRLELPAARGDAAHGARDVRGTLGAPQQPQPRKADRGERTVSTIARPVSPLSFEATIWVVMTRKLRRRIRRAELRQRLHEGQKPAPKARAEQRSVTFACSTAARPDARRRSR